MKNKDDKLREELKEELRREMQEDILKGYSTSVSKNNRGNIFTFFGGLIVFCIGIYMIFQNTTITTGFTLSRIFGFTPSFGLVLIPLLIGIIMLFFNGDSIWGWFLVIVGLLIVIVGILMGLRVRFNSVSLFEGVIMFGCTAAGIGITLKGLYGKNK